VNLDLWVLSTVAKKLSRSACQVAPSCPFWQQLEMCWKTWLIILSSFSAASSNWSDMEKLRPTSTEIRTR
jgi:hypothetical protein